MKFSIFFIKYLLENVESPYSGAPFPLGWSHIHIHIDRSIDRYLHKGTSMGEPMCNTCIHYGLCIGTSKGEPMRNIHDRFCKGNRMGQPRCNLHNAL